MGSKADRGWTAADLLSAVRDPAGGRVSARVRTAGGMVILAIAAATDLLDGPLARRFGCFGARQPASIPSPTSSSWRRRSAWSLCLGQPGSPTRSSGVLLRDIVATVAFAGHALSHRPRAIPARAGGKAVTVAQMLTLVAFLTGFAAAPADGLGHDRDRGLRDLGLLPGRARGRATGGRSGAVSGRDQAHRAATGSGDLIFRGGAPGGPSDRHRWGQRAGAGSDAPPCSSPPPPAPGRTW